MFDLNKMGFGASSNTWSLESLSLDYSSDVIDFGLESFEYNTGLESLSIATEGIFQTIKDAIVRFFKWIGEKLGLIKKQSSTVSEKAKEVVKQTEDVEKKAEEAKEVVNEVMKSEAVDKSAPIVTEAEIKKEEEKKEEPKKEPEKPKEEPKEEKKVETHKVVNKPNVTQFKTTNTANKEQDELKERIEKAIGTSGASSYSKKSFVSRLAFINSFSNSQLTNVKNNLDGVVSSGRKRRSALRYYLDNIEFQDDIVLDSIKAIMVANTSTVDNVEENIETLSKKEKELSEIKSKLDTDNKFLDESGVPLAELNKSIHNLQGHVTDSGSIKSFSKDLTAEKALSIIDNFEKGIFSNETTPTRILNYVEFQFKMKDQLDEVSKYVGFDGSFEKSVESGLNDFKNAEQGTIFKDGAQQAEEVKLLKSKINSVLKLVQEIYVPLMKFSVTINNELNNIINVAKVVNAITNDIANLRLALSKSVLENNTRGAMESFPGLEDLNYKVDLYKRMVTKGYSVELAMESMAVTHNLVVPNYYEYQIATEGIFESIKNAFRRFFEWLKEKLGFSKSKAEDIKSKTEEVKDEIKKSEENAEKSEKVAKAAEEVIKEAKDSQDPNKPRYDEKRYEYLSNKFDDELKKIYGETGNKFSVGKDSKAILGKMDYLSKISKSELEKVGKELGEVFKAEANRFNYLEQIQHTIEDKYPAWVRKLNIFIEKGKESKLEDSDSDFLRFEGNLHDDENKAKDKVSSVEQSLKPLLGGTSEEGITYNPSESFGYVIIRVKDTIHSAMGFNSQGIYELIEKRYAFEEKRNEIINKTIKTDDLTKLLEDTLKSLESDKEKSKDTIELFKKFQTDLMNLIKMHNRLQSDYVNFLKVVSLYFKFSNYMGNLSVEYKMARFHEEILKKKGKPDETN